MPLIREPNAAADINHSLAGAVIFDVEGHQAQIISIAQTDSEPNAVIKIEHGAELVVPISLLAAGQDGVFHLPFAFDVLAGKAAAKEEMVIPVLHEALQVGKRRVDTGRGVHIRKTVSEREHTVDALLMRDELVIEHVPAGQIVDAAQLPITRYDGDTLIVPILEEVLVVEKQIRLKEEVRITRRRHAVQTPQTVVLKAEQVSVEHFDEEGSQFQPDNIPHSAGGIIQPQSSLTPGKPAV